MLFERLIPQSKKKRKQEINRTCEVMRLKELKQQLNDLGEFPTDYKSSFQYAVDFFNIVSSFHDDGFIYNSPKTLNDEQHNFNACIHNCGRQSCGINRTVKGETVTLKNTYWGDIFGIWTFTGEHFMEDDATYPDFHRWLKEESKSKCEKNPPVAWVISTMQIKPFVENGRNRLIDLCDKLITA